MTTRKRNEWLDTGASDDEQENESELEVEEESRVRSAVKRRKISGTNVDEDDGYDSDDAEEDEDEDVADLLDEDPDPAEDEDEEEGEGGEEGDTSTADPDSQLMRELHDAENLTSAPLAPQSATTKASEQNTSTSTHISTRLKPNKSILKPSSTTSTTISTPKPKSKPNPPTKNKSGVIYISRIPPFMKPLTVRHLLTPLGTIGRIFLTPESPTTYSLRKRTGGNKKRSFTDGWVEFLSKKSAKLAAETLNAKPIGGKKGSWYRDDVWNIRYLKGFKWSHLTEQIANENAERAGRMRAEIARSTRENRMFVEDVERAKVVEGMRRKREGKREGGKGVDMDVDVDVADDPGGREDDIADTDGTPILERRNKPMKMHFKQSAVVKARSDHTGTGNTSISEQPDAVKRVLSKIF